MPVHLPVRTTWEPALVAVDVFLGPYPALVPVHRDPDAPLRPRFGLDVLYTLQHATRAFAAGDGPVVDIADGRVTSTTLRHGRVQPGQVIEPDADGLYAMDAPFGQWAVADTPWADDDECGCGACACPATCAVCGYPLGRGHGTWCAWRAGSQPWELPAISGAALVLDVHRHHPGCPLVRRRPGPLFPPGDEGCHLCGATGTRLAHTVTTGRGVEHHQRCRACGQVWHVTAAWTPTAQRPAPHGPHGRGAALTTRPSDHAATR